MWPSRPVRKLTALVGHVGPVEAADRIKLGDVTDGLGRRTEARRGTDCTARDLEVLDRHGGRLVAAADDEWPLLSFTAFAGVDHQLRSQAHPPLVLWVVGSARLDDMAERAAAIVGTRACTTYGEHVAADVAAGLVERDVSVVSGGAYGIVGAAHRACHRRFHRRGARGGHRYSLPCRPRRPAASELAAGPYRHRVSTRPAAGAIVSCTASGAAAPSKERRNGGMFSRHFRQHMSRR